MLLVEANPLGHVDPEIDFEHTPKLGWLAGCRSPGPSWLVDQDIWESAMEPKKEIMEPKKEIMEPQKEIMELQKEMMEPKQEIMEPKKEIMTQEGPGELGSSGLEIVASHPRPFCTCLGCKKVDYLFLSMFSSHSQPSSLPPCI